MVDWLGSLLLLLVDSLLFPLVLALFTGGDEDFLGGDDGALSGESSVTEMVGDGGRLG